MRLIVRILCTVVVTAFLLAALLLSGCGSGGDEGVGTTSTVSTAPPSTTSTTASPTTTTSPTTSTTESQPEPHTGIEYDRLPVTKKVVALTFDAAYDPAPLGDILEVLHDAGAPGTFFLTGEFVEDFPDSVRRIVEGGYPIGSHSYSHPDFTDLSLSAMRSQLRRTADLIVDAGAADPRPLFRPPFGARDSRVLSLLASEGYVSVYWTVDTLDWKPERTSEQIRTTVLSRLQPGAIILMHVGSRQTASVLPSLIDDIKARGYGFVTVREAIPETVNAGSG